MALAAGDVERHEDVVALFQILDRGADLLDDAAEFVAEGLADARVGDEPVIEMKVRPADARAGDLDDGVAGCSIFGIGFSSARTRYGPR
jgi:hypothetical protein